MKTPLPPITLEDFNLEAAERRLCVEALGLAGNNYRDRSSVLARPRLRLAARVR